MEEGPAVLLRVKSVVRYGMGLVFCMKIKCVKGYGQCCVYSLFDKKYW